MAKQIGILLFPDVEELDALGPWEVLSFWTRTFPADGYEVCTFSRDGGEIACAKGLTVRSGHSFADVPELDVLLHPGGQGTRPMLRDAEHLAWVREQRAAVPLLTSVCTGSLVFAAAGLLAGRPATTHWRSLELLAELEPTARVRPDDRFVDDGDLAPRGTSRRRTRWSNCTSTLATGTSSPNSAPTPTTRPGARYTLKRNESARSTDLRCSRSHTA